MRKRICIFLLLLAARVCIAQENYQVTSYGVDEGLPQSSIWDITQDRNGFLWVSTSDGLCRFDGFNFTVYKNKSKDSSSICGNRDHRFYVDKKGNLWIVCWNGISLYNDLTDNFTTIFTYAPEVPTDNFNNIFGEDAENIWTGMANCGLVKINKLTHKMTIIQHAGTKRLNNVLKWAGGFVEGGKIWISDNSGLMVYDIQHNTMTNAGYIKPLTSIINYNDSELLAGGDRCILLYNKRTCGITYLPIVLSHGPEMMVDILANKGDNVIVACHKGIVYYNIRQRKIVKSITSFDTQQKNKYGYAQALYRDKANNLWVGTNGDGVKKINYPYKNFLAYNTHNAISNLVKGIYADSQKVFVGYFDNGMNIFDREKGFEKNVRFDPDHKSSTDNTYAISYLGSKVYILHLASENRIVAYNTGSGAIKELSPYFRKIFPDLAQESTQYQFLLKERNGCILTAIGTCLVSINDPHSSVIRPSVLHRFNGETLCCCFEDDRGALWVGTMNCLYRCRAGNAWEKVALPENVQVKAINNDREGNIWVGTVKGIYLLDRQDKVIKYYSEGNGLTNQFVYGILRDDDGNMWFSHNKGLTVYNAHGHTFRNYYKEDGLQSSEFNTNAFFKSEDGMLFFGGINGVNAFNPREIKDNPVLPDVKITSIKLFDEPLKTDTAYWNLHSLILPYNKNSLSFEFAALEYSNPKKNQYAYMMQGLDQTWINESDKRFARYAAIPPGKYVFKVKASNNDGKWREQPTVLFITIVPPFWQQLWFRILGSILFISCIAGLILWIQHQRHKRQIRALELQQKIQLERERISRDLHDTVGTQLSLISNNIEWVAHPLMVISEGEKADKLQFVNNTARDIIATLRETIWALNKQQIPLEEFSDKLKAFVQKQFAIYPEIELKYNERIDEGIILGPSDALNLFRICQEAIANALKYAEASVINIVVHNEGMLFKISIVDNGKGFDINKVDPTVQNGIENMKYRAQDIGCVFEIHSAAGKGTSIAIASK